MNDDRTRRDRAPGTVTGPQKPYGEGGPTAVVYEAGEPMLVLRSAELRVVSGPDRGRKVPINLARVSVGAHPDNDLVLNETGISRFHLEVQVREEGYLVRDLGSSNGTYHRGARIEVAMLRPGSELRLARDTVLRIERGEESSASIEPELAFGTMIGSSRAMQKVFGVLTAVSPTDTTVLVLGETGTGKELVAEEIHRQSPRVTGPFVIIDCGAIPTELIESELFGHVAGAFTGARTDRAGAFERANGGTVFIDELGELPIELQTRLLRVLDRRTVKRVGDHQTRPIDVRVVAATNVDLEQRVADGRFRSDLWFRLSVVQVRLPSLRERPDDIPLLARHFLRQAGCAEPRAVLTPELLEVLCSRRWSGNVRELRNAVERAMVFADGVNPDFSRLSQQSSVQPPPAAARLARASAQPLASGQLPPTGKAPAPPPEGSGWLAAAMPPGLLALPYKDVKHDILTQFETYYLGNLVDEHGLNITHLATAAGVDRQLIRRLLRKHGFID
ncbi:MAG: sigma 54-dependent Fis family transcriptional regulator [Myxococcales bacterium]|nr:sigma 54-dependent Fis family transcriptional regulator [Myxococcales bacterium]